MNAPTARTPDLWSRFEPQGHGDAAWSAFAEYLHLGAPRPTIDDWARSRGEIYPGRSAEILRWSVEWMWDARVDAYDEWSSQASLRKHYPASHPLILSVMRMCASELRKYEKAQTLVEGHGFLTIDQCLKMMREVRAAERDISRLQAEQDTAKALGAVVQDFSRLSLEESRALDALLEKVTVR